MAGPGPADAACLLENKRADERREAPQKCPLALPSRRNDGVEIDSFQVFALNEQTAKLLQKVSERLRDAP
jgi:hypothetical protein